MRIGYGTCKGDSLSLIQEYLEYNYTDFEWFHSYQKNFNAERFVNYLGSEWIKVIIGFDVGNICLSDHNLTEELPDIFLFSTPGLLTQTRSNIMMIEPNSLI